MIIGVYSHYICKTCGIDSSSEQYGATGIVAYLRVGIGVICLTFATVYVLKYTAVEIGAGNVIRVRILFLI